MKLRAHRSSVSWLLLSLLPAASFAATEPKFDHYVRLTPESSAIGNFPAQKAPILTVKSGAIVKVDTGGGAGIESGMAVDFRITQIVDGTKGIHAMIPKSLFVNDKSDYWYKPGK